MRTLEVPSKEHIFPQRMFSTSIPFNQSRETDWLCFEKVPERCGESGGARAAGNRTGANHVE
jgi:hypothetical protein